MAFADIDNYIGRYKGLIIQFRTQKYLCAGNCFLLVDLDNRLINQRKADLRRFTSEKTYQFTKNLCPEVEFGQQLIVNNAEIMVI